MRITRREILKAIRTEKLKGDAFIHGKLLPDTIVFDPTNPNRVIYDHTCKVCAVGAVLRHKKIPDEQIEDAGYGSIECFENYIGADGDEQKALDDKEWLLALSIKFEKLYKSYGGGKRTKEKLAAFVKRHFPKEIRVQLW